MAPPKHEVRYREAGVEDVALLMRARCSDPGGPADRRTALYLAGTHHPQKALAPRVLYLATCEDTVVGYIAGHLTRRYDCDGELQYLWVDEELRRHGIASELLQRLAQWFVAQDASEVCVDVGTDAARAFYSARGATELNRHFLVWRDIEDSLLGAASETGGDV